MAGQAWFFGLLREVGSYRIVAAGPTEGRVRRALDGYSTPTMVVTRDDLPSLGVDERECRRWLPERQEASGASGASGAAGAAEAPGGGDGRPGRR